MNIIIVGAGKVGYYLAKTLLEHEHFPCLVEVDKQTCNRIANDLDIPIINGDGTSIDPLIHAGIESADALIGATGRDENNLIACQLAKMKFHVPKTIARVNNPKNVHAMKQLGVDITISSTNSIANMIEREVDVSAIKQLMALNRGEASLSEIQVPANYKLSGKTLAEIDVPEQTIIVGINRDDQLIIPRGNTQILSGDKIVIISKNSTMHELSERMMLNQ